MLLLIIAVVGLVVLVRIYHLMLQNRQLTLLLEERRLLIERGVTDLPPLQLPEMRTEKASRSTLIASIVLLLVSVAWLVSAFFLTRSSALVHSGVHVSLGVALGPGVLVGALGLLLLVIHAVSSAVSSYYARRQAQAPSGGEGGPEE